LKTVGKTVVLRNGKATVEEWPETHTDKNGNTATFKKTPGSVIVGDVTVNKPMVFNVGAGKQKNKLG
jgi:hypothetical protein